MKPGEEQEGMLQVQKKKRGGGSRRTALLLAALLLAGAAALWMMNREAETPMPVRTETGGTILAREKGSVVRLTVRIRGRESWTAVRDESGALRMEGGDGWTLDETLAARIEDALENLVYEEILTEDPAEYRDRLAEFGLADPALTATAVYADGGEVTFRIGDASGLADADWRFMLVEGDDRLYAVAGSLMEDLGPEEEVLRPVTQPEIQTDRLDRIAILDETGEITAAWTLEGKITDTDAAENWILRTDTLAYPADAEQIGNMKKNAGNLLLGVYIGEGTAENLRKTGLEAPKKTIELHLAAGTTGQLVDGNVYGAVDREAEWIRFQIGEARNGMTDYVLYDGVIYTMNHFALSALTEIDPRSTLSRHPVTVAAENLSGMTVRRPDGSADVYALSYQSRPSETEGEPDETVVTCTKNGEAYSYEAFAAAYERMRVVTVTGELPSGFEKRESTAVYEFRTLSGVTHIVELSPFDTMHDAVTVDGWTVFYLIRGGMTDEL